MEELNKKMFTGGMWMALLRVCVRGIGLISTVILARLLVPADFGLVAMATSLIAMVELATAFSFDIPLIQKQDAGRRHFDSAWTLNVLFYSGLSVLLIALAHPAAAFYQEARLVDVIYVLAIGFFAKGFENIGIVMFRKELDFRRDFALMVTKKLAGFMVTVPLAYFFRSYWALVAGMVTGNVIGVGLTYALHPYRPRFSLSAIGELMNFSKWLMINNVMNFLRMRSPDFIIGRISGTSSLGLFTVAFELSTLPTTELVAPINRAVFPGYSKLASDLPALRRSYLDVLAVISLLALPAGFGLSAVAAPLIDLLLGDKWGSAAPIVAILAIFGGINAIQSNTGSVYNAIGKPYLISIMGFINISILVTSSILLALRSGPIGVATAYLGTTLVMAPLSYYIVSRYLNMHWSSVLGVLWKPIAGSLLMYGGVTFLGDIIATQYQLGSFTTLALLTLAGGLVYALAIYALWLVTGQPRNAEYRLATLAGRKLKDAVARSG